jgi:hypothetical protein
VTGDGPGVGRLATAVVGVSLSKKRLERRGSWTEDCKGGKGDALWAVGDCQWDDAEMSHHSTWKDLRPWDRRGNKRGRKTDIESVQH